MQADACRGMSKFLDYTTFKLLELAKKLSSLFGGSPGSGNRKDSGAFPWRPLETQEALQELWAGKDARPRVIFKHSTRCGLSGMMLRRFQKNWEAARDQADFYLLDLIRNRGLSEEIVQKTGIPHQSPQVLVLGPEGVRDHDSHGGIDRLRPDPESKSPA